VHSLCKGPASPPLLGHRRLQSRCLPDERRQIARRVAELDDLVTAARGSIVPRPAAIVQAAHLDTGLPQVVVAMVPGCLAILRRLPEARRPQGRVRAGP